MKDYQNILIIKMSSLGDIIHALPTLYALRQNLPHAKITWAVHPQFAHILPGKPWIDEVILVEKKGLKSLSYIRKLWKDLYSRHFDMTLDLQCIAKSALVSFCSGAPERYGYWELREGSQLVNKALVGDHKYDHVIERYLDTVRALGGQVQDLVFPLSRSQKDALEVKRKLMAQGLPEVAIDKGDYIVIAPGARWALKEWPVSHYAELIKRFLDQGQWVVLMGSPDDCQKSQSILDLVEDPRLIDLTGHTSLPELIELIEASKLYISADTGPLHLANALKKPLIAMYGTTSPDRTGPYGGDHVHIIQSPTSRATAKEPLVKDPDCMGHISVDSVWEAYQKVKEEGHGTQS